MIFVTGGTGLLGTYLLYELVSNGKKVKAMIRPGHDKKDIKTLFNCLDCLPDIIYSQIEWIEGDILDVHSLENAMKGVTQVYHCAAMISFNPGERALMQRNNVEGTANVVNACFNQKVEKLVHVSSISTLGNSVENKPKDEKFSWKTSRKNSGYAVSKYGSEREVWRGIEEGLNAVIVNPSMIMGVGCRQSLMNPIFKAFRYFMPFYIDGVTGYVDVRDVAKAMVLLMESDISGERFVISSENLTQREVFNLAAEILGKKKPYIHVNRTIIGALFLEEKLRSALTGTAPLFTRENARSAMGKNYYTAEKFIKCFNYEFIPIKESLKYAFDILNKNGYQVK
jgi:dihydroflavonol-4-reductase